MPAKLLNDAGRRQAASRGMRASRMPRAEQNPLMNKSRGSRGIKIKIIRERRLAEPVHAVFTISRDIRS
jgi:hypothetical protein